MAVHQDVQIACYKDEIGKLRGLHTFISADTVEHLQRVCTKLPDVSTHFSGHSKEEIFFFPMFMRLLSFRPAPDFLLTKQK